MPLTPSLTRRDWKPNTDVVGAMEAIEGAISINIDYYQLINLLRQPQIRQVTKHMLADSVG